MRHQEDWIIQDGDRLIFFVTRRHVTQELEKLIQSKPGLFA